MIPRFEMKGVRSWSEGRRARAEQAARDAHSSNGGGGTPALQEILAAYDRRFEESASRERDDREQRARFREEAGRILEAVIVPTLVALGEEVARHGHVWNVESRVDIMGQPAVGCSFSPRETSGSDRKASELGFRFHFPDRLAITAFASEGAELRELPPRSYEMSRVTESAVKDEIVRFVKQALAEAH